MTESENQKLDFRIEIGSWTKLNSYLRICRIKKMFKGTQNKVIKIAIKM